MVRDTNEDSEMSWTDGVWWTDCLVKITDTMKCTRTDILKR